MPSKEVDTLRDAIKNALYKAYNEFKATAGEVHKIANFLKQHIKSEFKSHTQLEKRRMSQVTSRREREREGERELC